jgi:hypothetical protein
MISMRAGSISDIYRMSQHGNTDVSYIITLFDNQKEAQSALPDLARNRR